MWGNGGIAPPFLTSAIDVGKCSASRPCYFTPVEGALGTHWMGGCVGPRVYLAALEYIKIACPCLKSNPSHSSRSPALY
jgi:hypothetical protein